MQNLDKGSNTEMFSRQRNSSVYGNRYSVRGRYDRRRIIALKQLEFEEQENEQDARLRLEELELKEKELTLQVKLKN